MVRLFNYRPYVLCYLAGVYFTASHAGSRRRHRSIYFFKPSTARPSFVRVRAHGSSVSHPVLLAARSDRGATVAGFAIACIGVVVVPRRR
jgi:hypothetical protein